MNHETEVFCCLRSQQLHRIAGDEVTYDPRLPRRCLRCWFRDRFGLLGMRVRNALGAPARRRRYAGEWKRTLDGLD